RRKAGLQCVVGERVFAGEQSCAADRLLHDAELMTEGLGDLFEDQDCLLCDFRANPITGKNRQIEVHERTRSSPKTDLRGVDKRSLRYIATFLVRHTHI